jgi:hypothetical protein
MRCDAAPGESLPVRLLLQEGNWRGAVAGESGTSSRPHQLPTQPANVYVRAFQGVPAICRAFH